MDHVPQDHQIPADAPTHPATLGSGVQLPMISTEPGAGPELVASLVPHRSRGGGVATLDENYGDRGFLTKGSLAGAFDGLTAAELLALADPDLRGLRRVILAEAGHARCARLMVTQRWAAPWIPDPQVPTTTAAGHQSSRTVSGSAAVGQPNPTSRVGGSSAGRWWARGRDERRPHPLAPADVVGVAATNASPRPEVGSAGGPAGPRLGGGVGG